MVKINYSKMTLEQLQQLATKVNKERAKIVQEHKAVAEAIDIKLAQESAAEKLAAMSPAEREAVKQSIGQDD